MSHWLLSWLHIIVYSERFKYIFYVGICNNILLQPILLIQPEFLITAQHTSLIELMALSSLPHRQSPQALFIIFFCLNLSLVPKVYLSCFNETTRKFLRAEITSCNSHESFQNLGSAWLPITWRALGKMTDYWFSPPRNTSLVRQMLYQTSQGLPMHLLWDSVQSPGVKEKCCINLQGEDYINELRGGGRLFRHGN